MTAMLPSAPRARAAALLLATGPAWLAGCGTSGAHALDGAGRNASDAGAAAEDGAVIEFDAADSSAANHGGESGADGATSPDDAAARDGSTTHDAGSTRALWSPSPTDPIHFHWLIGASTVTTANILLSGQAGQVVYDIDGQNATAADVAAIHAAGAVAICYVDVGSLEQGRPDYAQFPASVIGPAVQGWPGENWLLVTAANQPVILPLMQARFENWCLAKGFDAIEPDNLDAWTNISNVTEADNLTYDLAIGQLAHALPISIGLKNIATDLDASQLPMFVAAFDWALNEQCFQYQECDAYTGAGSFLPSGKAVFDVEYSTTPDCTQAGSWQMNAQETDLDLVGVMDPGYAYEPCVPDAQITW
jgi:hypothetical protein